MLEELATFCAVARCGSMSRAAADLHLSQPAISQRLRALEEEHGLPLFRRTNRGVELTPAGDVLYRYARRLLSLQDSLQQELGALRSGEPRQITIGATSTIGGYALPCTIYLFQQKHPDARIHQMIGKRAETLQRLHDGILDLALVEGPQTTEHEVNGWQSVVVSEDDLVLITPVSGPLAERSAYTLEDLRHVPLILREPGSGIRLTFEDTIREQGLSLNDFRLAMEMSRVDAIKTSVAAGHGVAIISKWCVRVEARMGTVRLTPLDGVRFISRWTLVYPPTGRRTMLHRSLLRTLRSPADRGFC